MKTLIGALTLQVFFILPIEAQRVTQDIAHGRESHSPPPQQQDPEPKLRVAIDLADGSRIIGNPRRDSVRLRTPYAKLALPLNHVQLMTIGNNHKTALFKMGNGDSLSGALGKAPIELHSVLGNLTIATEHIVKLKVLQPNRNQGPLQVGFEPHASGSITTNPYTRYAVADFNNDRLPDFAVSDKNKGSESVDVYLNSGSGVLVLQESYPMGHFPEHIGTGDFDEDGNVDLLVAVYDGRLGHGTMRLFKGDGDGSFVAGPGFSPKVNGKGLNPCRLAIGDLNNDDHLDFVVEMNNDWALNVHWGDGKGNFEPRASCPNGQNPGNTEIVDLNNDGWPDIVSGSQYTSLFVHLSDRAGGYEAPVQYLKGTTRRQPVVVGDLDNDGDIDLLVADSKSRYASVMLNNGDGGFTETEKVGCPDGAWLAKLTDLDLDGRLDCVLASGKKLMVLPGKGDGSFHSLAIHDLGHSVSALELHDLNHDGLLDIVCLDREKHQIRMHLTIAR